MSHTTIYNASLFIILSLCLFVATTSFVGATTLERGMYGEEVRQLQMLLNEDPDTIVAASGPGSAGYETTYFGPATEAAVKRFQAKYAKDILSPLGHSVPTGVAGTATLGMLAVVSPAEQFPLAAAVSPVILALDIPAPRCTFTASPTEIQAGQPVTLTWSTTEVRSTFFDQGLQEIMQKAQGRKVTITPSRSTIYTMIGMGYNGGVTRCQTKVTVQTPSTSLPSATSSQPATPSVLISPTPTPTPALIPTPIPPQPIGVKTPPTSIGTKVSSTTLAVGERYPNLLKGQAVVKTISNGNLALALVYQKNPNRSRDCDPKSFTSVSYGSVMASVAPGARSKYIWQVTDTPSLVNKTFPKPTVEGSACQEVIGTYTLFSPTRNISTAGTYTVKVGDNKGELAKGTFNISTTTIDNDAYYRDRNAGRVTAVDTTLEAAKNLSVAIGVGLQLEGPYHYYTTNRANIEINWGDGQKEEAKNTQFMWLVGARQLYANHAYATGGTYTITVNVYNDATSSYNKKLLGAKTMVVTLPASTQVPNPTTKPPYPGYKSPIGGDKNSYGSSGTGSGTTGGTPSGGPSTGNNPSSGGGLNLGDMPGSNFSGF